MTCDLFHKRDLKSILSLLGHWHSKKGVHEMQFNRIFESSLYRKRQKTCGQLKQGSQVEDVVTVPHFFAQATYSPFCERGHYAFSVDVGRL